MSESTEFSLYSDEDKEMAAKLINDIHEGIDCRESRATLRRAIAVIAAMLSDEINGKNTRQLDTMIDKLNKLLNEPPVQPCSVLVAHGREFRFNDHVCVEMLMGFSDEMRTGRLVQVRRGCGQFGSNVYLIRLRDGSLMSFENVMIRHVDDERFVDAFYRANGQPPPVIPEQAPNESDAVTEAYSIAGKWPETGFIVDAPKQPETPGSFALTISSPNT